MESAEVGGRVRQVCPACGFILYRNPVPGVGTLIEMGGGIVLVQRGQPPFVGSWALPAGYIEADESVEQAAVREALEETGLEVELDELFGVYSFPEGPVQSGIVIFYRARPVGGFLRAGDDADDVRVFAADKLPEHVAFRTHREVLARWLQLPSDHPAEDLAPVSIREADAHDEQRVLELLALIPENALTTPADAQAAAQRFRERLTMDVLVAQADGLVVGFVAVSFVNTLSGIRALINDLAVDAHYRRRGIGGALLEAGIRCADRRGATHLLVDASRGDTATREFYRASGFETGRVVPLRIR
jgi:ADP-ribose pyrophosphatase YjhB (NUDIX family)/ribosomal protein S18 acetylase RimI-like enzyme